jgi:2-methylfumaryl-CoA isomerase
MADGLTAGAAPLAGMRVIEISSFVAAPLCGLTLAQLGAEVIRVDPYRGAADAGRWPLAPSGTSLYWTGLNKGKRSVVLDLRSAEGRELLAGLVAAPGDGGGIVLTNVAGPAWASYAELSRRRPDLIHLQIRGRADGSPAVDYTVNAASGFPLATGPEEFAGAVNHVFPAWDVACGLYAATGLLSAERSRRLTGAGQSLTLALEDVALVLAGHLGFLAQAQLTGEGRPRIGNHLYGGFGRDFVTRDGTRMMVVTLTDRHFRDLGRVTGLTETFAGLERLLEADFSQDGDRYAHREVIASLITRWFAGHSDAEAAAALAGSSVLWSRYRSFSEVAADPALADNPVLRLIDQPGVGRVLAAGLPLVPADLGSAGGGPAAFGSPVPAPAMGADTAAVLSELLGLAPAQISDLADRGIAAVPAPAELTSEGDPA